MRTCLVGLIFCILVANPLVAYEWKTHFGAAWSSRNLFLRKEPPPVSAEVELVQFLRDHGSDLDSRAGDPYDNAFTDEDHNEGFMTELYGCRYVERDCYNLGLTLRNPLWVAPCTINHFFPRMALPFGLGDDAPVHARRYFDMAVRLYKAGKCDRWGLKDGYMRDAARALGHAIHLAEDMGAPQHVRPENHVYFPLGHGPSFHEFWVLDLWDQPADYTKPDGSGNVQVGGFLASALRATTPRRGRLEGIMGSMAAESRRFFATSPYEPGTTTPLTELQRVLAKSEWTPDWSSIDAPEMPAVQWVLPSFMARQCPSYGPMTKECGSKHHYFVFNAVAFPDFTPSGDVAPPDSGRVQIGSFELAERLWAEPDIVHPEYPVELNARINELITHTTETAAGVILSFWEEVRNYSCKCKNFTPCDFRPGAVDPDCQRRWSGLTPPSGDAPDDTPGVVATTSTLTAPSVSDLSSADISSRWPAIASVGVEKELPSLVDFGRLMYLFSLGGLADLPEASQEKIAIGVAELEGKYSVNRARPEDDLPKAAHVAVLDNGFADDMAAMLDAFGWTHSRVPLIFDPLALAADRRVLVIPSGGLYGTSGSPELRQRLQAFVETGGTLVVMAQMRGDDFTSVPTPPGEPLKAYGWFEDQSRQHRCA